MPSSDGTSAGSSQKLKPKASKTNLTSPGKSDGSVSKKTKAPRESALLKAAGDDAPAAKKKTGDGAGVSGKSPKVSAKSPKVSGKSPAASATSGSSTSLKVKKKKSSTTGQALNPKKSSLRKTAPADAEPIQPTDDLEPVGAETDKDAEESDEPEDTTVAYKKPPADADDSDAADEAKDGVTETYVLNKDDEEAAEKAQAKKKKSSEDDGEDEGEIEEIADDADADEKAKDDADDSDDEAKDGDKAEDDKEKSADDEAKDGDAEKDKKGAAGKASRRVKSSKRTPATDEEADAKAAERTSRRTAEQKKSDRFRAKLFLFFAIGSLVGIVLIVIVLIHRYYNTPKVELNVYAVPAFKDESFDTMQSDFTADANPMPTLKTLNPDLPGDKPFTKDELRVKVVIPKSWGTLNSDVSFVNHFMAQVDKDLQKGDLPAAHRDMVTLHRMADRFIMHVSSNTPETKKKFKQDVDDLEAQITRADKDGDSGPAPAGGGATPGTTGSTPGATAPTEAAIEDQNKKLRRLGSLCNPINDFVFQAHRQLDMGKKDDALAELKKGLDLIAQLKSIATLGPTETKDINNIKATVADAKESQVLNAIAKGDKIQPLFDKGQALTTADIEAAFPDTKPSPQGPEGIPDGPTEAK